MQQFTNYVVLLCNNVYNNVDLAKSQCPKVRTYAYVAPVSWAGLLLVRQGRHVLK